MAQPHWLKQIKALAKTYGLKHCNALIQTDELWFKHNKNLNVQVNNDKTLTDKNDALKW